MICEALCGGSLYALPSEPGDLGCPAHCSPIRKAKPDLILSCANAEGRGGMQSIVDFEVVTSFESRKAKFKSEERL